MAYGSAGPQESRGLRMAYGSAGPQESRFQFPGIGWENEKLGFRIPYRLQHTLAGNEESCECLVHWLYHEG